MRTNRIIEALLAKTTARGATPGEAASALEKARQICRAHRLPEESFLWPEPPHGWAWEGDAVVRLPEPVRKAKSAPRARAAKPKGSPFEEQLRDWAKREAAKQKQRARKAAERDPFEEALKAERAERGKEYRAAGGATKDTILKFRLMNGGLTLDEMVALTGWQRHTVRGWLSRNLRGKVYREGKKYFL